MGIGWRGGVTGDVGLLVILWCFGGFGGRWEEVEVVGGWVVGWV